MNDVRVGPRPALVLRTAALATGLLLAMVLPAVAAGGGSPLPTESGCIPEYDQTLAPAVLDGRTGLVLLGETMTATLRVKAICAYWPVYRHIVLALDVTPSMSAKARRRVLDTARAAVPHFLPAWGRVGLGMVAYDGRGLTTCEVSDDAAALDRCVARLDTPHGSGGDVAARDLGIADARELLLRARKRLTGHFFVRDILVVISDGAMADASAAKHASRDVQRDDGFVITACASSSCESRLLADVATSPRYAYPWTALPTGLYGPTGRYYDDGVQVGIRNLSISATLPDDVTYLTGSANPAPDRQSADGRKLSWRFNYVPKDGVTITLALRPERSGDQQPILSATGALTDSQRLTKAWAFPDLRSVVLGARP